MINPLREKQIKTLNAINCDDLARKIDEIVRFCNEADELFELDRARLEEKYLKKPKITKPQEKETPMGISKWLAHGKRYGYDKYQEKKRTLEFNHDDGLEPQEKCEHEKQYPKCITVEEIWDMLFESYPKDMENFDTITESQAYRLLHKFWKKLEKKSQ